MTPPRPTMTAEDVRKLREFFDSPAGQRMLGQINRAYDIRPITGDRQEPDAFWLDIDGNRIEAEGACAEPLDPSRTFPAPPAHSVIHQAPKLRDWIFSPFGPLVWISGLSALGLGTWLVWVVVATIRSHA